MLVNKRAAKLTLERGDVSSMFVTISKAAQSNCSYFIWLVKKLDFTEALVCTDECKFK